MINSNLLPKLKIRPDTQVPIAPLGINVNRPIRELRVEPIMTNRFLVTFPEEVGIAPYIVSTITLPTYINEVVNFSDRNMAFRGRSYWSDIVITFNQLIDNTAQQLFNMISSELRGFSFIVDMLDPTGVSVSRWEIHDAIVTEYSFGKLSMNTNEVNTISLTIRPGRCALIY